MLLISTLAAMLFLGQSTSATELFDGFDEGYGRWQITGQAFGRSPSTGSLPGQQPVIGTEGSGFINTFLNGDRSTGRAVSIDFTITKPYISFRVGGGGDSQRLGLRLMIDGQLAAEAVGRNSEELEFGCWNVSRWKGKVAHLEIVDESTQAWGHILVDQVEFRDALPDIKKRVAPRKYLVVPVYFDDTTDTCPHPPSYYKALLGSTWPGVGNYFALSSYNTASLQGSVALDWTHLPGNAGGYISVASWSGKRTWDFERLLNGLKKVYGDKLKLQEWYGIFFCPNVLDDFGGGAATWIPQNIGDKSVMYPIGFLNHTQGQSVWVHEMSHHFGIGHSGQTSDGRPEDCMNGMAFWGVNHPEYGGLAVGHCAFNRLRAGWIPSHRIMRILAKGDSLEFELSRLSKPESSSKPLVCIIPDAQVKSKCYMIEARHRTGEDKEGNLQAEGIVIYEINYANTDKEMSRQTHESSYGDQNNSVWLPGETFESPNGQIKVSVIRRTDAGFVIRCTTK